MSMLQELQSIRKQLGEKEFSLIEKFLTAHPHLLLTDIYYNTETYKEYEKWKDRNK